MKAITIHQPWSSLIAYGFKRYETRGWRTHYRGPIAIHAGKYIDGVACAMVWEKYPSIWREISPFPTGKILAVAELMECWMIGQDSIFEDKTYRAIMIDQQEKNFGWFAPGRFAWELANVHLLSKPIPAKGKQGLWNWDEVCADCELPFLHDRYNAFCNECGDRAYREANESAGNQRESKRMKGDHQC